MMAPADVPAMFTHRVMPASSAASSAPTNAIPFTPPPSKTPSALSVSSGAAGASAASIARCVFMPLRSNHAPSLERKQPLDSPATEPAAHARLHRRVTGDPPRTPAPASAALHEKRKPEPRLAWPCGATRYAANGNP
jgi:hypothetical protein